MSIVARLRAKLGLSPASLAEVRWTTVSDDGSQPWAKLHVISTLAGHKPSGLADAFGGYLCACRAASWSTLDSYGPYGGCSVGWYDAKEFLARYGVPQPIDFEAARRHHDFGHRNGLTPCDHSDPLCVKYGCSDDPDRKG